MVWDVSALVLILLEALAVPSAIAFEDGDLLGMSWQVFVISFFACDILLNMITTFESRHGPVSDARLTAVLACFFPPSLCAHSSSEAVIMIL